jgi:hypothetical protein
MFGSVYSVIYITYLNAIEATLSLSVEPLEPAVHLDELVTQSSDVVRVLSVLQELLTNKISHKIPEPSKITR